MAYKVAWINPETLENIEEALDKRMLYVAIGKTVPIQRYWLVRRNGRTKLWKTSARFRIPFKAGLKVYGIIDETTDLTNFRVANSREDAER